MSGNVFVSHRAPCSEQKMDGKHYKGKIYGARNLADCDRNIAGSDDDRLHGERYSVVQLYFPVRPDQRGGQSGKEHPYSLCILGISVYGGASGTSLEHKEPFCILRTTGKPWTVFAGLHSDDGNDRVCYLLWGQAVIRCQRYYMAYMEMLR